MRIEELTRKAADPSPWDYRRYEVLKTLLPVESEEGAKRLNDILQDKKNAFTELFVSRLNGI